MRNIFLTTLFGCVLFYSGILEANTQTLFRVGLIYRFDNKYDRSTKSITDGLEFARQKFEKENPNLRVSFLRFSHGKDLASTAEAAEAAAKANVDAVIGGEVSEEAVVIGDILNKNKIPFITATSSNPSVTKGKEFVFRACFSDADVARLMAKFVFEKLKPAKVGIIHNVSSPYTDFLATAFKEQYSLNDPKSRILVTKIVKSTFDFAPIVDEFRAAGVTHVIMLTHDGDLLTFNAEATSKKYFPTYIGSDGWGSNESIFKKLVKENSAGKHFLSFRNNYWHQEARTKKNIAFKSEFKKTFGVAPDAWNAISNDAGMILFHAFKNSDPQNSSSLKKALEDLDLSNLVTSESFKFDVNRSPVRPLSIYRIGKDGISFESAIK